MSKLLSVQVRRRVALITALLPFVAIWIGAAKAEDLAGPEPLVAAAADLQFALPQIIRLFTSETGKRVRVTFGSSGNIASQIRSGAPIALFLSADENLVLDLAKRGLTDGEGALYARGRIALLVPPRSPLKLDASLADLAAALADGRLKRFAIANPEHAPYGARAKEVLSSRGLWERIEPCLVLGENVSQTAQFALSGATQGGIIAHSLALAPEVAERADHVLIPEDWHTPLLQRMVLARNAPDSARQLYQFIQQPKSREILARYGFVLPE